MESDTFTGLHREGIVFLDALGQNNDPLFFNANKEQFVVHVKEPLQQLNTLLKPLINKIDPDLDTRHQRVLCRIRKDARYAKGEPYRNNMWMSYKPIDKGNTEYFTYYFYFDVEHYGVGIGYYGARAQQMQDFRDRIDGNIETFLKVINSLDNQKYILHGEDYVRKKNSHDLPDKIEKWYNKKSFYVSYDRPLDNLCFTDELHKMVEDAFISLVPLYDFVLGREIRFNFSF